MATFKTFDEALSFGKREGRDHVYPFQKWRVVPEGNGFALAIVNVNSGRQEGFINA